MSVITVTDLHTVTDPEERLSRAASLAHGLGGTDLHRIVVRCPDRATDGIRALRAEDVAAMLRRHGKIVELGVTDQGTIVGAVDLCKRRGEIAVWTGYAIGPWHPSDIVQRGLGGSETAAVRLAEQLAEMGYIVTLYGQFEQDHGMAGDVVLRDFRSFDPTRELEALIGFRDARLFEQRPNARFCALWLEDLPGQEQLTAARAANLDRVCAVSHWHKAAIERHYPWIAEMEDPADPRAGPGRRADPHLLEVVRHLLPDVRGDRRAPEDDRAARAAGRSPDRGWPRAAGAREPDALLAGVVPPVVVHGRGRPVP